MAQINISQRDMDYIARVVDTEVPASLLRKDPEEYGRMVRAVVDTITNRLASPHYPKTVTGVLNQRRQFSKIAGPKNLNPYGTVQNAPRARAITQSLVANHLADRAKGVPSTIGGALSYANPNYSTRNNQGWINGMINNGAIKLGIGRDVHWHGTVPGMQPAGEYSLAVEGVPSGWVPAPLSRDQVTKPQVDPQSAVNAFRSRPPTAATPSDPASLSESIANAFSSARFGVNPAVAAIDAQMGKTPTVSQASFNDQRAAFSAAQQAAARQAQAQAVSAQQQQANQARAAQMAQYGVGQQAMRSALSSQQPSQVSAKTSRIGADARAALAAGLADQRAGLTSQTPIGIAGRTIGAMAGSFATPTKATDTFSELAGKVTNAADAVAKAKPSMADALNKQTAELTSRQVSQPSVGPQPAMNALSNVASSIDPSAMAKSFNSFTHTPIGSYAKNTALGNFAQGLALAADVATPEAATALAAGMTPQDVFGMTAPTTSLDAFAVNTPTDVTTSALASYAPSDVTGSVLSGALNDMERAGTDFAGGATGLSAVDRNAADNLPGRYGPRAGIALGGLLGSALGGPLGGLLGAMAGGSLANRSGPAGGTGGLLGGMFGGSYSGDGNQGPGPGGRGALGGGSAGTSNSGGSRKNEQGSRR